MEPITETRKRNAGMSVLLGRLMRRLSLGTRPQARQPAWQPEASRFVLETLDPLILLSGDPITASVPLGFQASAAADLTVRLLDVDGVKSVRIDGSDNGEAVSKTQALADLVGVGVSITGSSGNDTLHLDSSLTGSGLQIRFDAGAGSDTVTGPGFETRWALSGTGKVQASQAQDGQASGQVLLQATGVEAVVGDLKAVDTVAANGALSWAASELGTVSVAGVVVSNADSLVAGVGSTLDYSAYQEAVKVDLGQGQASGFASATGFTHLVGSAYGDLLIGDVQATV